MDIIAIIQALAPIIAAALSAWAVIVSKQTATAVDGKMTEVITLVRKAAFAEGKEDERAASVARKGVADAAILAEKDKTPVVTPAAAAATLIQPVSEKPTT